MGSKESAQVQRWDPERYRSNAAHVQDLGRELIERLQPRAGERILDLGCGEGRLTLQLAQLGASVVGIDGSPELVADARSRGLDARVMNGENLTFEAEFDAVYSNAALHWMRDADAVIAGVRRALKPKGRFVAIFCGHGHAAAVHTALIAVLQRRGIDGAARMSWYLPTPEEYRAKLEAHGFVVEAVESAAALTPLPAGLRGLLETFYNSFVEEFDQRERSKVFDETMNLLAPSLRGRQGDWSYDAVRLHCKATLSPA